MTQIREQNVIITGANRGVGRIIARFFAERGATVGVLGRRSGAIEKAARELRRTTENSEVSSLVADVSEFEETINVIGEWVDIHDGIDTLVNNAGLIRDGLLMRMDDDDWNQVLEVNLDGAFNCTRAVIRSMIRNHWGRIIMISSVAGLRGNPGQANYSAAKSGLIGLSKSIARELGSRRITCNVIAPGYIETEMTEELTEDRKAAILEATPMDRFCEPNEVAECTLFLASNRASFITGEVIRVDGGMGM